MPKVLHIRFRLIGPCWISSWLLCRAARHCLDGLYRNSAKWRVRFSNIKIVIGRASLVRRRALDNAVVLSWPHETAHVPNPNQKFDRKGPCVPLKHGGNFYIAIHNIVSLPWIGSVDSEPALDSRRARTDWSVSILHGCPGRLKLRRTPSWKHLNGIWTLIPFDALTSKHIQWISDPIKARFCHGPFDVLGTRA